MLKIMLLYSQLLHAQLVAVIDTGFDFKNTHLKNNLWSNPKEIPNNQIDDDDNGYIDDVHGWDFVADRPLAIDNHGHGTHVVGLIIEQHPSDIKIMVLKYYDQRTTFTDTLMNTVRAMRYATLMGADIINYSSGGNTGHAREKRAIEQARERGILVVTAAGNNGTDMAREKFFPAAYGLSNLLAVTAVDQDKNILPTSNYGQDLVDIAAPGKNLLSWVPGGKHSRMTGTSQATALVTGQAARLLSTRPELKGNPRQLIRVLKAGADTAGSLSGKVKDLALLNGSASLYLRDAGETAMGHAQIPDRFQAAFTAP